jgi:hypothetical protein
MTRGLVVSVVGLWLLELVPLLFVLTHDDSDGELRTD